MLVDAVRQSPAPGRPAAQHRGRVADLQQLQSVDRHFFARRVGSGSKPRQHLRFPRWPIAVVSEERVAIRSGPAEGHDRVASHRFALPLGTRFPEREDENKPRGGCLPPVSDPSGLLEHTEGWSATGYQSANLHFAMIIKREYTVSTCL